MVLVDLDPLSLSSSSQYTLTSLLLAAAADAAFPCGQRLHCNSHLWLISGCSATCACLRWCGGGGLVMQGRVAASLTSLTSICKGQLGRVVTFWGASMQLPKILQRSPSCSRSTRLLPWCPLPWRGKHGRGEGGHCILNPMQGVGLPGKVDRL